MQKRLAILLLLIFVVPGCVTRSGATEEHIEAKSKELSALVASKIVHIEEGPYLGAKAVKLPKAATEFTSGVFAQKYTLNKRGSLSEICAAISKDTGLPISAPDGLETRRLSGSRSNITVLSGTAMDQQLNEALGDVPQSIPVAHNTPAKPTPVYGSGGGGIRIVHQGTVKSTLDILASRFGLSWNYKPETGVVFSSDTIKTFTIWASIGKVGLKDTITSESKESNSGNNSSSATQAETAQTNTTEIEFDIWKDVETEIKSLLSSSGSVTINQAAGTVTVKDTPRILHEVEQYVADLNERLSKQIALSIKVWSLEIDDSSEAGLDLGVFFSNPDVKVFAGGSPLSFLGKGGEVSSAIVSGSMKDTKAVLKGLRGLGKATQVTSGSGIVMNNQAMPVQALKKDAYLASSSRTQGEYGDTTELVPGEIKVGFAMTVRPHIMDGRRVVLQYSVNLSSLDNLTEFKSGDSTIQLPKISTRSFSQRMALKVGQTLVLAGFEQESDGRDTRGGFLGFSKSRQYKRSLIIITISTESGEV